MAQTSLIPVDEDGSQDTGDEKRVFHFQEKYPEFSPNHASPITQRLAPNLRLQNRASAPVLTSRIHKKESMS